MAAVWSSFVALIIPIYLTRGLNKQQALLSQGKKRETFAALIVPAAEVIYTSLRFSVAETQAVPFQLSPDKV